MEIIQRMNKKLDLGWKLTNSNCEKCNGVTLADPSNVTQYYCPKCDKIFQFKQQEEQEIQNENRPSATYEEKQRQEDDYFNEVIASSEVFSKKQPQTQIAPKNNSNNGQHRQDIGQYTYQRKQQRSKDVSKKLGEKLLQGWTMLEQSCLDCNVPLMKSRKGEKLCLGCDKDYAAIEAEKQNNNKPAPINKAIEKPSKIIPQKAQLLSSTATQYPSQQSPTAFSTNPSSSQLLIQAIECKALRFLQFKMDKAIDENDIGAVEKIVSIVQRLKKQ